MLPTLPPANHKCTNEPSLYSGSDSAPHSLVSKTNSQAPPAGVFTQIFATQYVLLALEDATRLNVIDPKDVTQERLEQFLSLSGRKFYKLPHDAASIPKIALTRRGSKIPERISNEDDSLKIGLVRAGNPILSLSWV